MDIVFQPHRQFSQRYKALLVGDWSYDAFENALLLVREELADAGFAFSLSDERDADDAPQTYPIPPGASEQLREHLERSNYQLILEHQQKAPLIEAKRRQKRLRATALATSLLLAFPQWPLFLRGAEQGPSPFAVSGNPRLFDDSRSVLFLLTVHELMPKISHLPDLRELVLHSLYTHASVVWTHDPAHQHFLLAQFFDSIENADRCARHLALSFRVTPSDAHDYFTKAFAYWSYEADRGEIGLATAFALRLLREAPVLWVKDAEELVASSFRLQYARNAK